MLRLPVLLITRAIAHTGCRALLSGLVIGAVVHALAQHNDGSAFGLAMALVLVVSGCIAFVLHAAAGAMPAPAAHATRAARLDAARAVLARARGWLLALGSGIVGALHGLSALGA